MPDDEGEEGEEGARRTAEGGRDGQVRCQSRGESRDRAQLASSQVESIGSKCKSESNPSQVQI